MKLIVEKFEDINLNPNISAIQNIYLHLAILEEVSKLPNKDDSTSFSNPSFLKQTLYSNSIAAMIDGIKNLDPKFVSQYPSLLEIYEFINQNNFTEIKLAFCSSLLTPESCTDNVKEIMQSNWEKTYAVIYDRLGNILLNELAVTELPKVSIDGEVSKKFLQIQEFATLAKKTIKFQHSKLDPELLAIFEHLAIHSFLLTDYATTQYDLEINALMSVISSATAWRIMNYQNTHDAQDPWSKKIQYLKAQYKYFMDFSWDQLSIADASEISKYLLIDILSEKSISTLKHQHPSFSPSAETQVLKQSPSSKSGKKTTKLQKNDDLDDFLQNDSKFFIWSDKSVKLSDHDAEWTSGYMSELFLRIIKMTTIDDNLEEIYKKLPTKHIKAKDADSWKSLTLNQGSRSYIKIDKTNLKKIKELIVKIKDKATDFENFFDTKLFAKLEKFFNFSTSEFDAYMRDLTENERDAFVRSFEYHHHEYWQTHISAQQPNSLQHFRPLEFAKRQALVSTASELLVQLIHHPLFDSSVKVPVDVIILTDIHRLCDGKNLLHQIFDYNTHNSKIQHLFNSITLEIAPVSALVYGLDTEKIFWSLINNGANFGKPSLIGSALALNLNKQSDDIVSALRVLYPIIFSEQDLAMHLQDKTKLIQEHNKLLEFYHNQFVEGELQTVGELASDNLCE
jgi:hypothetical protein